MSRRVHIAQDAVLSVCNDLAAHHGHGADRNLARFASRVRFRQRFAHPPFFCFGHRNYANVSRMRRIVYSVAASLRGSDLAETFLEAGLIDELGLKIVPILLGKGIPLFPKLSRELPLRLTEEKAFPDGVLLHYEIQN